ncbi:MAG: phosphate:Na+ symporter [Candidatus Omnitrophota bacterium]|jgi:phosphate:Na+ symporter
MFTKELIFGMIGGLGFFFFGMKTMSQGLKDVAGDKLKSFMHKVTKNRFSGIAVGTGITLLVQSSSATTVMVVGFVNAGLLTLKQAITVIMGANIGTTFTAWLVSSMSVFKLSSYALPAIGIGFFMSSMCKSIKKKHWGQVILGFGLLFIGLHYMKEAFAPLKGSEQLHDIFATFSVNPLLGIFAGLVFTVILQSSSATIAIVQVLAFNGVISFESAIPIILGDNIGTTITAQMAAIGANINARRAAMSHTLFNVIGTAYMLVFVQLGWFESFVQMVIPGEISTVNVMFYIAVSHSTFNVVNTIVFIPFVGFLEKMSIKLVKKGEEAIDFSTQYLEKHLLATPTLALEVVHKENEYMLKVARKATMNATDSLVDGDAKKIEKTFELETFSDELQSEITQYLIDLSQGNLTPDQSSEMPVLIHTVNDIERIADHAQNLAIISRRKASENLVFSKEATDEIDLMISKVMTMFDKTEQALSSGNKEEANEVLALEDEVNKMHEAYKDTHFKRLNSKECKIQSGFLFLEYIDNLEKIADKLTNIAQSILIKMRWNAEVKEEN